MGYIDAISELIDFRKINGASDTVLRNLSSTELYLKRARKTVAKMMRLQWTQDLDIETLDASAPVVIKASNKYHLIVRGLFKNFKTPTNNKLLRRMLLVGVLKFLNKPLTTGRICLTLLLLLV